ncbi:DEAD/DEAH box helicase [Endozoicomonas sp.]|uniref:DEAD/DEAH box helicase n=1 Tax=Endozoicomonas sp. TaxID=1892382 RepID=UPI003AF5E1A1
MAASELLDYVLQEKAHAEEEIRRLTNLPEETQVEKGLLVPEMTLVKQDGNELLFSCSVNHSRVKPGDRVELCRSGKWEACTVIENLQDEITVLIKDLGKSYPQDQPYQLRVVHYQLLEPVIATLEGMRDGAPGKGFWDTLFGEKAIKPKGLGGLTASAAINLLEGRELNSTQLLAAQRILAKPSLLAVQGPPGTGKTRLLASVTQAFIQKKQRIAVLAPTHQAVNNALSVIAEACPDLQAFKIGEKLKSSGLSEKVHTRTIAQFNSDCRKKKIAPNVVGMTFYSAITNLGLRSSPFAPNIILVDEAGQLPLSYGALTGTFGAGSVVCFGDDAQLPPIFQGELESHSCSKSLFSAIRSSNPDAIVALDLSYRMNSEICSLISRNYYRTADGQEFLKTSNKISGDLSLPLSAEIEPWIHTVINSDKSVHHLTQFSDDNCQQENAGEAQAIAKLASAYLRSGGSPDELIIVAPYRKQISVIKSCLRQLWDGTFPAIDSVERVQGLGADFVIISMTSSDFFHIRDNEKFLCSPNRLNVALSRAKRKVVVFIHGNIEPQIGIDWH